jgi:choline kinase
VHGGASPDEAGEAAGVRRSEFQVVILGGAGSSLSTLTTGYPKPLLPILNRPMISYQLALLEKHGFSEAILVVDGFDAEQADMLAAVVDYIAEFNTKSKLHVSCVVVSLLPPRPVQLSLRG